MSTKRFTILVVAVMFLITLVPPWSFPAHALPALVQTGDMDIDGFCRYLGYNGARLDPTQQNVFGWGCLQSDGTQAGMDLFALCKWQYGGSMPYPEYSDYNNPYSWYCSSEDLGSPAPRPASRYNNQATPSSHIEGVCPGFTYSTPTDIYFEPDGSLWLRESPSLSAKKIKEVPADAGIGFVSTGETTCAEGYTWQVFHFEGVTGWILVYNEGEQQPVLPTIVSQPTVTPQPTLAPDFSQPNQNNSGTLESNPILLPTAVHICDPACDEEDGNWVTFFLPTNKFKAASEQLHSNSFFGSILAVFSKPSICRPDKNPAASDGFLCEEMGLSHTLVNFFVKFGLVSLDSLRDPSNWSLTYTSQ